MGRRFSESMVKRDRRGRFAEKAGGGWLGEVAHRMSQQLGGKSKGAGRNLSAPADRATARSARGPMSDAEFEARGKMITDVVGKAIKTHATDKTMVDADDNWRPERDKLHHEIANELYARAANVPNERRAVIAGGLGGAGKTTVLKKHAGIDPSQYLTLNPDDVKELMAERKLIPDVPGADLSPMERAALVHEESSRITGLVAEMALRDGKNMMWDITMSSSGSVVKRIDALKRAGFGEIRGVFVDIPVEVSVKRAMARYRRGADDFRAGKGMGGRFVPPKIIRAQRTSSGETINRKVFEELSGQFTDWSMYDNSVDGRAPKLINRRGRNETSAREARGGSRNDMMDFLGAASAPAAPREGRYLEWPRMGRA